MKVYFLLILATVMINISAREAEVRQNVMVKDNTYNCLFKMHYEENTCLDTSQASCSPKIEGKKKTVNDVRFKLDDGIIIHIRKLRLLKRGKTKIIGCKAISPITTNTTDTKPEFIFESDQKKSTKSAFSFKNCVNNWCPQRDTNQQYTRCESTRDNGLTCVNPQIKYGSTEYGIPVLPSTVNFALVCKQLFGNAYKGGIDFTTGPRSCSNPLGAVFWCQGYDEERQKWCDRKDGFWKDSSLDNHQCSNAITSLTCGDPSLRRCITSPGYPSPGYSNNMVELLNMTTPVGHAMKITFEGFDLEGWGCRYDYLQFYDSNGARVGNKLCGNTLPSPFIIQSKMALAVFVSDFIIPKPGFKFCYEPYDGVCKDKYPTGCAKWGGKGWCSGAVASFMATNCAKSCGC